MVPQTPVGSEGDNREEGNRKVDREREEERGIEGFRRERRAVSYPTLLSSFINFKLQKCLCVSVYLCESYLRASTLASESASRIPFLMLSTRTAVCLQGRDTEIQMAY